MSRCRFCIICEKSFLSLRGAVTCSPACRRANRLDIKRRAAAKYSKTDKGKIVASRAATKYRATEHARIEAARRMRKMRSTPEGRRKTAAARARWLADPDHRKKMLALWREYQRQRRATWTPEERRSHYQKWLENMSPESVEAMLKKKNIRKKQHRRAALKAQTAAQAAAILVRADEKGIP